jgi:outer membrane protein assembly factor BamA
MTQSWKQLFVVWLGLYGLAHAQPQSRSELIDSARAEKEANLTPETTPKPERRIEGVEHSWPYRVLTEDIDGFSIAYGGILPGWGFAVGPRYTRSDLWGGKLTAKAEVRAAVNESYVGRLDLALPHLFNDRAFLNFSTIHRNISEMPYYGSGPQSRKTGRSDYRLEDTNVELRPGVRIYKGLKATAIGSFLAVNIGTGHATRYISSELQFSPAVAPGIDRQTNFWRGGGLVEFDWRDRASNPTSGGRYAAQYVRYLATDLGRFSFFRLDLDASQYIPLVNRTHVIALHGASSLTTTGANQTVPFYLQPTLGGPETLRGYRVNRFYGDNSTIVNGEYRWDASPILQMVAFADAGKVFNRWEQWNFHGIQSDVGFGLRFRGRSKVAVSLETGFSHEGFQVWFRVNNSSM